MKHDVVLTERQIGEIKLLADDTRKGFGIYCDVPMAKDLFSLLEKKKIILCQYPFQAEKQSHTDASITWFETKYGPITFIGLNTSLNFDEQIFAIAHELYHYITRTGKAYHADIEEEDRLTERKADRFAAELLLPREALYDRVITQFGTKDLGQVSKLRLLRFIVRLQEEWWLPYHSLVMRVYEEGYVSEKVFRALFELDDRTPDSLYSLLFSNLAPDCWKILNEKTMKTDISGSVMELFIQNYEDGYTSDDEFVKLLSMFGKSPSELGYDLRVEEKDLDELKELFEGGDADES